MLYSPGAQKPPPARNWDSSQTFLVETSTTTSPGLKSVSSPNCNQYCTIYTSTKTLPSTNKNAWRRNRSKNSLHGTSEKVSSRSPWQTYGTPLTNSTACNFETYAPHTATYNPGPSQGQVVPTRHPGQKTTQAELLTSLRKQGTPQCIWDVPHRQTSRPHHIQIAISNEDKL